MHNYPSDISREAFDIIREKLEQAKKRTKPRKIDLYDIFCAILYLIKSGCQWRMLPIDFPKTGIVHYYYDGWISRRDSGRIVSVNYIIPCKWLFSLLLLFSLEDFEQALRDTP